MTQFQSRNGCMNRLEITMLTDGTTKRRYVDVIPNKLRINLKYWQRAVYSNELPVDGQYLTANVYLLSIVAINVM